MIDIQPYVPHEGPMSLLDTIVAHDEESLTATLTVKAGATFENEGQVPAWVGIEYMAQAIAAYAGMTAHVANEAVKPGFLIGIRQYNSDVPAFKVGDQLTVRVERVVMGENGLGVFQCQIELDGNKAEAKLNVFQPDNLEEFMK